MSVPSFVLCCRCAWIKDEDKKTFQFFLDKEKSHSFNGMGQFFLDKEKSQKKITLSESFIIHLLFIFYSLDDTY
jgi:hypothetical protein